LMTLKRKRLVRAAAHTAALITESFDNVDVASGVDAAEAWRAGAAVALIFVAFFSRCF